MRLHGCTAVNGNVQRLQRRRRRETTEGDDGGRRGRKTTEGDDGGRRQMKREDDEGGRWTETAEGDDGEKTGKTGKTTETGDHTETMEMETEKMESTATMLKPLALQPSTLPPPLPRCLRRASTLPPPRFHAASAASTLPPPLPRCLRRSEKRAFDEDCRAPLSFPVVISDVEAVVGDTRKDRLKPTLAVGAHDLGAAVLQIHVLERGLVKR